MLSDKARKLGEEPAFPYTVKEGDEVWSGGMTKREYFAALAMQGLLASIPTAAQIGALDDKRVIFEGRASTAQVIAKQSIEVADALLEALVKEEG